MRPTAVQSHKGVQHVFEMNIKLCSTRLTAVQISLKEVKECMEGGQFYDRMDFC
jgi:hypothetical protein